VLSELVSQGVDSSHVRVVEGEATAETEIALGDGGERRFLRERYTIHETYDPGEKEWAFLAEARHVHASRLPRHLERLLSLGAEGVMVSYDFSVDELPARLDGLEIAFLPHDRLDPGADPKRAAHELVEHGCHCAVVTLGAEGSIAATASDDSAVPARPLASVVDTCGAGDAFIAAFIAARIEGKYLQACLEEGAAAGAEACSYIGAFPQEPLPALAPS
jgi:fructoselysine 6-kinase